MNLLALDLQDASQWVKLQASMKLAKCVLKRSWLS